ncbi:MAG: hypothetical protein ACOY30_03975 [Bacillota bacterium]
MSTLITALRKCPQCGYMVEDVFAMRCPRCHKSLLDMCSCRGNCSNCGGNVQGNKEGCNPAPAKK